MPITAPKIKPIQFSDILQRLKSFIPHYTPEWKAPQDDCGAALLKLFSHLAEHVATRFNQVPQKSFIAFLDMLGFKLLPAQPAKVPLTFKLVSGAEHEVLIPARTQTAADKTEQHDEIYFETETNLLCSPAELTTVISIDPQKDAIYLPPPGFLTPSAKEKQTLLYRLLTPLSKGGRKIQLDHVTQLAAEDFISLEYGGVRQYFVIEDLKGNIVKLKDSAEHDFPTGAAVEKVIDFKLFEGKNFQEHSIYLGHDLLFNIKSKALFYIEILHKTASSSDSMNVEWQYWGETDEDKTAEWRTIEAVDDTDGLSLDGTIRLAKLKSGEIKELELNNIKSRWMRCLLKESLTTEANKRLPTIDQIAFTLRSSAERLLPDKAFDNEIPLEASKPFAPFGKEPRLFERFALASKEAFSKKGAQIELDVEVEPRGVIGPPAAIPYNDNLMIKVFVVGTERKLKEIRFPAANTSSAEWIDHGSPIGARLSDSAAPAIADIDSIFVCTEDGRLFERYYNGQQWLWLDHGNMGKNVKVTLEPSAVRVVGFISVFVTGSDGSLYEFARLNYVMVGNWINHGHPQNKALKSAPFALGYPLARKERARVFVVTTEGLLAEYDCGLNLSNKNTKVWNLYEPEDSVVLVSKPFAVFYYSGTPVTITSTIHESASKLQQENPFSAKIFVIESTGHLVEFDSENKGTVLIFDYPSLSVKLVSAPYGCIDDPIKKIGKHIFVRGDDGMLWERQDSDWFDHQCVTGTSLIFNPFVLPVDNGLHVFSTSARTSLLERSIIKGNQGETKIWNEYRDPNETALTPNLSWEYFNKSGWVAISGLGDETDNFLKSGVIKFTLPEDIEETEIAGQKNYWIRAKIISGDYGREKVTMLYAQATAAQELRAVQAVAQQALTQQLVTSKETIRPPIIKRLSISYVLEQRQFPQYCITFNNLEYIDQTEACISDGKFFQPFIALEERRKSLFLGFDRALSGGPLRLFFHAHELPFREEDKPKFEWRCSRRDDWYLLSYLDSTEALIKREILEFIAPLDLVAKTAFGQLRFWLKGSLTEGAYLEEENGLSYLPELQGIYPNTAWALQAETIRDEVLGSGSGQSNQTVQTMLWPVSEEEIRVRELLSEEEKHNLINEFGDQVIYEVKGEKGEVLETWVLWQEVSDFFQSRAHDRHYLVDRAIGFIQFGDGIHGKLPFRAENNIKAFMYRSGGGKQGNVDRGEIKSLRTAVANVEKAFNYIAADGGADTASVEQMLEIAPPAISHGDQAVSAEDFEWLAYQASRKIARVKCLPMVNNLGETQKGWVALIVIPDSSAEQPMPTLELRKIVEQHLLAHSANTVSHARHVMVTSPRYLPVSVTALIYVDALHLAGAVDLAIRNRLAQFFHPLTGGVSQSGWDFGRSATLSDMYALLESIDGIDHVHSLSTEFDQTQIQEAGKFAEYFLLANGQHQITLRV